MNPKELIDKLVTHSKLSEQFFISTIRKKASDAAEIYPNDQTLISLSNVLAKKEGFISRQDLRQLYNTFYHSNTKAKEIFAKELELDESPIKLAAPRNSKEGKDILQEYPVTTDYGFSSLFNKEFDKGLPEQKYSSAIATQALQTCKFSLNLIGTPAKSIKVTAGNSKVLICQAEYMTPKGSIQIMLPVEIKENRPIYPKFFITASGTDQLTKDSLQDHLKKSAGQRLTLSPQALLKVAENNLQKNDKKAEEALLKIKLAGTDFNQLVPEGNQVIGFDLYPEQTMVNIAVENSNPEIQSFSKKLASSMAAAEFTFGKNVVKQAEDIIKITLNKLGYSKYQSKITDCDNSTIYYIIGFGPQYSFKLPVKIENKQAQFPKIFIDNNSNIQKLSSENLSNVLSKPNQITDITFSKFASTNEEELVGRLKVAMKQKNFDQANEILDVIKQNYGEKSYRNGFKVYSSLLNDPTSLDEKSSVCKMQRKQANSIYPICGHTNLPITKVYQDEYGDCQPLYRKNVKQATDFLSINI